ncbi:MAG: bifunctional UDP-N-acetylmuramoyl-tripeptide:D-alanyl-D-alanine ligase/alanine racemase [Bacteroidales bacterium]|nr:bifunctional UDP-N-acetylmuramoyl-tripeptide:D-alanyl-D-alanine ligase/alanine racemase [Bacteroidales bacterium]
MPDYSLQKLADITGGKLTGRKEHTFRQLVTDSRNTALPASSLFIAINGKQHNGHRYIPELYQQGIRAFLVSELPDSQAFPEAGFVTVNDTLSALHSLVRFHRAQFSCPVIAITGSNGKTIIKEWLYHCLSSQYNITRSPKSYNSQLGVPLSLWHLEPATEMGIFEAGISQPGEMQRLQHIIRPDIGIFVNIGEAHQENFASTEEKISEKLKLFHGCKSLVYCADHTVIKQVIEQTPEMQGTRLFTWSTQGYGHVNIRVTGRESGRTSIEITHDKQPLMVTIPYDDPASVENALHCLTLMLLLKTDQAIITARLADLPPVAMRLEQKSAINGCTLINDSYNSDLNSLSIALDVLNRQLQHKRKTLILSDIFQSGRSSDDLYSQVAMLVKEKGVTRIIGIGNTISENASRFTIPASFYANTETFITTYDAAGFDNEAILLKGSRKFEFEKIAALLEHKKHTTRVEINLNALAHNLNYFRSLLAPGVKTMVMVKALSYGSGRHEVASVLQFQRVDYLGVAIADEGVSLRQAGINLPIIVMNPEIHSFDTIIQYRLEPEIYSFGMLDAFNRAAMRNQEIDYPIHIKIDTGMHRLGLLREEVGQLCHRLSLLKHLKVASVFSHLAGSDEAVFDEFTNQQIELFRQLSGEIQYTLGYPVIRHILNTSGIERFRQAQFDMVRLGIGLYGISVNGQDKLRNVSTFRSTILQIKPVEPGETVGYSRKGKPSQPSLIAVVPVGYADGLNRKFGNGNGYMLVRGKKAPVIGNICMDMTMIDVTGIGAAEGDEVIIFGEEIPITLVAEKLGTIPYEILTGISERVKRVYFHE